MNRILEFLRKHLTGAYHIKISKTRQVNFAKLGGLFTLGIISIGLSSEVFPPLVYIGYPLIGIVLLSYLYFYILKPSKQKQD